MDNSGDKKLSKEELKFGLQDYGIEINIRELDEIFNYFGKTPVRYPPLHCFFTDSLCYFCVQIVIAVVL